jgi:hypothetical protein
MCAKNAATPPAGAVLARTIVVVAKQAGHMGYFAPLLAVFSK